MIDYESTLKDVAREIASGCAVMGYCAEFVVEDNNDIFNVEVVVTHINGKKCANQYVSDTWLPVWKRWIKKILKL